MTLSPTVDSLDTFVQKYQAIAFGSARSAIAVLNGGFFDASNAKTTSYIIEKGQIVGDPKQNRRLMQNPQLSPYLTQIFNRSEFRRYLCGNTVKYEIASRLVKGH